MSSTNLEPTIEDIENDILSSERNLQVLTSGQGSLVMDNGNWARIKGIADYGHKYGFPMNYRNEAERRLIMRNKALSWYYGVVVDEARDKMQSLGMVLWDFREPFGENMGKITDSNIKRELVAKGTEFYRKSNDIKEIQEALLAFQVKARDYLKQGSTSLG